MDVIITNLHLGYDRAVILPPIQPDVVGVGRPSDHAVAVARPNVDSAFRTGFLRKETRTRRSMSLSNLALLGLFLANFNWSELAGVSGTDEKLSYVNNVLFSAQEAYCPLQQFTVKTGRYPYASVKLANLSKQKAKEFRLNRYSPHFKQLKKECRAEIKLSQQRRIEEAVGIILCLGDWSSCLILVGRLTNRRVYFLSIVLLA